MSDEPFDIEKALENLEEIMEDTDIDDVEPEEVNDYIGSHGLEDPGLTEYNVAKEIAREIPDLFDIGGEIYASASALKHYEFEGELPEGADIVLRSEDLGAGEGRRYEREFDDVPYNIKVQDRVNPLGLRRII